MRHSWTKRLRHGLEWAVLHILFALMRCVGLRRGSNLMGWLARRVGPRLGKKNRIARTNLRLAFPDWTEQQINDTVAGVWENMGRYLAEFPLIAPMPAEEFRQIAEIRGEEHMKAAAASGKGMLLFSAHMANWELGAKASWACDTPFAVVYRPLNNPWVDTLTNNHRNQYQLRGLPKNTQGSRDLLKTLRDGEPVAILIDQKMNTGIPVPFFGREAMTSPAIAELAIKYGVPIIPTRVERLGRNARFRITFEPPVEWESTGDKKADAKAIMCKLHDIMEGWIRERPDQWFWVHKRWG